MQTTRLQRATAMENTSTPMRESTAHNLISVINSTLQTPSISRLPLHSNTPRPSVLQEMTRSFPGAFIKSRGKGRFVTAKRKAPKEVLVSFYLLPRMTDKTPNPKEEFKFIQAGLGKRNLEVTDGNSHMELSEMLCLEYPKMRDLEGGWLLYKAMGGFGQRPLTVITPEAEGYTGALMQVASNRGKSTLFIVPLQKEIDVRPLPQSSKEFDKMPKANCSKCNKQMPLAFLAGHIATCEVSEVSSCESNQDLDHFFEDDDLEYVPPPPEVLTPEKPANASCPICQGDFSQDDIAVHASLCGESLETNCGTSFKDNGHAQSLDDILQALAQEVDSSERFELQFFSPWPSTVEETKKNTPKCSLKINFVGEPGVDTGAIKKEFLTDMLSGIELRYFEPGTDNHGKNPIYSISALEENNFRSFGEIMTVSSVQGGPAPAFMHNWCYAYLATGDFECVTVTTEDVTDTEAKDLIEKVRAATNENLLGLSDDLLSCGYTGRINTDKKDVIIRTVSLHSLARLLPLLDQMRKSMQLYNFSHVMQQNVDLCRPLFVPLQDNKPDANFIMASCRPAFSEEGTTKRSLEQDILNHFQDFLQELEDDDDIPEHSGQNEDTEEINNKQLTVPSL